MTSESDRTPVQDPQLFSHGLGNAHRDFLCVTEGENDITPEENPRPAKLNLVPRYAQRWVTDAKRKQHRSVKRIRSSGKPNSRGVAKPSHTDRVKEWACGFCFSVRFGLPLEASAEREPARHQADQETKSGKTDGKKKSSEQNQQENRYKIKSHSRWHRIPLAYLSHGGLKAALWETTVYTPTGNGLGLDSSELTPVRQRSKRPCNRLINPVYQ